MAVRFSIRPSSRRSSRRAATAVVLLALVGLLGGLGAGCGGRVKSPAHGARGPAPDLWNDPRPGSAAAPLPIGGLPFTHRGDTAIEGEPGPGRDVCAPGIRLRGPQVSYALTLLEPRIVTAAVIAEPGVHVSVLLTTWAGQCLMRGRQHLSRRVLPGRYRLVVQTRGQVGGRYQLDVVSRPPAPRVLGSVWNTYYYLAQESDYAGEPSDTPLLGPDCGILGDVSKTFHDDLCIEGSGLLDDGRVVNYASGCTRQCFAAVPCGKRRYKICYRVLDKERYPYGMGSQGRVLVPDRSIAVDPEVIPLGTVLYVPELDGVIPPGRSAPLDGCVRADDVGGAIKGDHIDIFAATRARWRAWERIFPTRSWFTLIADHPRCDDVPGAAGGGLSRLGAGPRAPAPAPARESAPVGSPARESDPAHESTPPPRKEARP